VKVEMVARQRRLSENPAAEFKWKVSAWTHDVVYITHNHNSQSTPLAHRW
jgi:predicted metal-dependent HD superfamily phosphohydrolase